MATHNILHWPIPEALATCKAVVYRNQFANKLARMPVEEAIRSYVYLTPEDLANLLETAIAHVHPFKLSGVGVELGAGCALLSSVVARRFDVEKIYAVEVCRAIAETLAPRVAEFVLNGRADRVVPTVGSFDDMQLPDGSLDFAIEIDSLHHSDDLVTTLRECARVLRAGALLICFDRAHPDSVSDEQITKLLDHVYGASFLEANGYPADSRLTRRENGEHEYRLREWRYAFSRAGFEVLGARRVHKRITFNRATKGMLSVLPGAISRRLTRTGDATLSSTLHFMLHFLPKTPTQCGSSLIGPKDTTIFVARRL